MAEIQTTVYLSEALRTELSALASETGVSEAELIQHAVARFLEAERRRPRPRLPLFRSGDPTLAERLDEALSGLGV